MSSSDPVCQDTSTALSEPNASNDMSFTAVGVGTSAKYRISVATASLVVQSRVNPRGSKEDTLASASMVDVLLFTLTKALLVLSIPCTLVGFEPSLSATAEAPWPPVRSAAPRPNRVWGTSAACVTSWKLERSTALGLKPTPVTDCPPLNVTMWQTQSAPAAVVPVTL